MFCFIILEKGCLFRFFLFVHFPMAAECIKLCSFYIPLYVQIGSHFICFLFLLISHHYPHSHCLSPFTVFLSFTLVHLLQSASFHFTLLLMVPWINENVCQREISFVLQGTRQPPWCCCLDKMYPVHPLKW